jgi:Chemoreceptor zinc-binding domain
MSDAREINKAIAAHGTWKVRIYEAIEKGSSEFKPETVRLDNACDFGKWLHAIPKEERGGEYWEQVRVIHAKFHEAAATILKLAVAGKGREALELISDLKGDYVSTSILLTNTLQEWKNSLPAQ